MLVVAFAILFVVLNKTNANTSIMTANADDDQQRFKRQYYSRCPSGESEQPGVANCLAPVICGSGYRCLYSAQAGNYLCCGSYQSGGQPYYDPYGNNGGYNNGNNNGGNGGYNNQPYYNPYNNQG